MILPRVKQTLTGACLAAGLSCASGAWAAPYTLTVDASAELGPLNRFWQQSVGSDHLYTVLGSAEGANAQSAYAMAASELGMKTIRGHGILNDDVGIYSEANGQPQYNWTNYDKIMDYILSQGMKPLVELSFMPSALASGGATFGWYNGKPGNITPPKSYDRWQELIYNLAKHSIEKYGAAEVESWYFEVWNEPDLKDFFSGTQAEYLQMYDRAVAGLAQASPNLKVGGPSVAIIGSGWIGALIDHCMTQNKRLDFISWHKYPYPSDARALNIGDGNVEVTNIIKAKKAQYPALNVQNFLTEWNSSFTGGDSFNNEMGASFVARAVHGMFEDQNGVPPPDRAAFWVISDIWEEWDSRQGPAFDVMGLIMRKHDVRKPSYLAFQMLGRSYDRRIAFSGGTDQEIGLNGFATLSTNGKGVSILIYDHHYGDGQYANTVTDQVTLQIKNLPFSKPNVEVERVGVDRNHNNAFRVWDTAGRPDSPSEQLWQQMKTAGALSAIEPKQVKPLENGAITLTFDQLQPGVSLVTVTEEGANPNEIPSTGGTGGAGGAGGAGAGASGASATAGVAGVASGGASAGGAPPLTGGTALASGGNASGGLASSAAGQSSGATPVATPADCGCRAPGSSRHGAASAAALVLALALVRRRRR
jgi:xylan 1,4-beta-xylosidase